MSKFVRLRSAVLGLAALAAVACQAPDARQELEVVSFEAYWVIDRSSGGTIYLAPAARVEVRNTRDEESRAIQATANFRIEDPAHADKAWSAWERVTGESRLQPGETATVLLVSDGRYTSAGPPEAFFEHELFSDVRVEVFFRVGSSEWASLAEGPVPRRIGSTGVVLGPP